jgi:hypothetical protein
MSPLCHRRHDILFNENLFKFHNDDRNKDLPYLDFSVQNSSAVQYSLKNIKNNHPDLIKYKIDCTIRFRQIPKKRHYQLYAKI